MRTEIIPKTDLKMSMPPAKEKSKRLTFTRFKVRNEIPQRDISAQNPDELYTQADIDRAVLAERERIASLLAEGLNQLYLDGDTMEIVTTITMRGKFIIREKIVESILRLIGERK